MIIIDQVKNLSNYPEYKQVEKFLKEQGNPPLPDGKYVLDNDCYVAVSSYTTVAPDGLFEGHLQYVDLQVIIEGEEYVHVQEKSKCTPEKAYDESKDAAFYRADFWHSFYLGKGFFAVFDEEDLHRPCISVNGAKAVKKYVFKIKKKRD